jgi:SAM-dependent methyltransferase
MHARAQRFYQEHLGPLPPLRVVELGSFNINGTARTAYPQAESWWGIDLVPGPGVDEVADCTTWTTDDPFDVCVSAGVFEHTPDWPALIATAHRVLKPGGLLFASCATGNHPPHSAVDGAELRDGEWYENVDQDHMYDVLKDVGFSQWDVETVDGHYGGDDLQVCATR